MKNFIEFKKEVLADFYKAMHTQEADNYDYQRFSYDGIDRSKIFNSEEHQYFLNWLFENFQNIFKAYSFLEDDESKKIYKELIVYNIHFYYDWYFNATTVISTKKDTIVSIWNSK